MKYVIIMVFSASLVMSMNSYHNRRIPSPAFGILQVRDSSKSSADSASKKQNIFKKIARLFHKKKVIPIDTLKARNETGKFSGIPHQLKTKDSLRTNGLTKNPASTLRNSFSNFFGLLRNKNVIRTRIDSSQGKNLKLSSYGIKSPIDTSKKKTLPIKIHGNALISGYYSDYQYPGQSSPSNYVRTQISPSIEAFGIPFKVNAFVSSEQNVFKNLDVLSVSFDWNRMREIANDALKQSMNERQLVQNKIDADQLLKIQEFNQLEKLLNDKDYLASIESEKKLLEQKPKLDSFGLAQNARQLETAENDVKKYEGQLVRYEELRPGVQQYNEDLVKQRMLALQQSEQGTVSQRLNATASPYGKYLGLLYAIKSFDIGMCHPVYSDLTMNGSLGIKGFNFAINPDNVFFGVTEGKTIFSNTSIVGNAWQYNQVPRDIYAIRGGYGIVDKAIITVTLLQGIDLPGATIISDTSGVSSARYRNTVASIYGLLNYHDLFSFSAEGAKSVSNPLDPNDLKPAISIPSNLFSDNTAGGASWSLKGVARIPVIQTRITATWQQIGANYNSYGLAYIQNDVQLYNFKIDQDIFHHHITASVFLKKQSDNLLQTEQFQTVTRSYGGSASFRWANLPVLIVSYSPTAQYSVMHLSGKDSTVFASNLFTASMTYTRQKAKLISSTTLCYTSSKTNALENNYTNSTITINQLLNVSGLFSVMGSGSYVNAFGLLGYSALLLSGSVEKPIKKGMTLKSGLYYQDQSNSGFRKGIFLELAIPVSKYASLQVRGDYFKVADITDDYIPQLHYSINTSLMVRW